MTRKPVQIRMTKENAAVALVLGDIILDAEELGVVASARMDVRGENAVVYFMGGDCEREVFGVPQTLTVLRDPEGSDWEWTGRPLGTHVMAEVSKVGGGTTGRRYGGDWRVRITQRGKVVMDDVLHAPHKRLTHAEAAREAYAFLDDAYEYSV
jgi:hypothetical protein